MPVVHLLAGSGLQNGRFLRLEGENATLKAGLQLILAEPASVEARQPLEERLREISDVLHFDFWLASTPEGVPITDVMRVGEQFFPLATASISRNSQRRPCSQGTAGC